MQSLSEIIRRQQAARPPHDDPVTERVLAELLALAEEVCVLRDRLDTCRRLIAAGEPADAAAIDAYEPDAAVIEERLASHTQFFAELFERLSAANRA